MLRDWSLEVDGDFDIWDLKPLLIQSCSRSSLANKEQIPQNIIGAGKLVRESNFRQATLLAYVP